LENIIVKFDRFGRFANLEDSITILPIAGC